MRFSVESLCLQSPKNASPPITPGNPALILARGTADPLADARRQQEIGTPRFGRPTGGWDLIHGELVTFTDPQRDLPPTCPGIACKATTDRPAGRISASRAQHVPAGDGGGAVRGHPDFRMDLLDAMPALRGERRQRPVVTSVSRLLPPYPDESV